MRVLIQCGDSVENQNRIYSLAELLCINGHEPVVMLYSREANNIFKINNIRHIFLEDYKKRIINSVDIHTKLTNKISVGDIIKEEGARRPDILWPGKIGTTCRSVLETWRGLLAVLKESSYDFLCIWNGYTGFVANCLRFIASEFKYKSAYLERGLLKNSLFIDRKGVNGASSLATLVEPAQASSEDVSEIYKLFPALSQARLELLDQDKTKETKLQTNKVFLPLQVQNDTNIILYSKYNTMREVFFDVYKAFNSSSTEFVVRPHPEELPSTNINIPKYKNVIFDQSGSLNDCIKNCNIVVTVNSTVGLEALLLGKKVYCLGKSIYSSLRCIHKIGQTNQIIGSEEILRILENYFVHICQNHLLARENRFNCAVMNSIFNVAFPCNIDCSKMERDKRRIELIKKNARIYLDIDFSKRLNLTYRKSKVLISREYLDQMMRNFGVENFEYVKDVDVANIVVTNRENKKNIVKEKLIVDVCGFVIN